MVKLRSNLQSQISFQLTNENLIPDSEDQKNFENTQPFSPPEGLSITEGSQSVRSSMNSFSRFYSNTDVFSTIERDFSSLYSQISRTSSNDVNSIQPVSVSTPPKNLVLSGGYQFNQLFNYVNLIDHVFLAAGQTESNLI
jgi:hypothetical protein